MIMAGICGGRSSNARIRASSSALLFVAGLVPYEAGRGCTLASSGIVGVWVHVPSREVLLMARSTALAAASPVLAVFGWGGGKVEAALGGWYEPSIATMSGDW